MNTIKHVYDKALFYKIIGMHPEHVKQRERYEQRLAALKQKGKLYESANECVPDALSAETRVARATNDAPVGSIAEYNLVHYWRAGD
jgi:hypothetical protein